MFNPFLIGYNTFTLTYINALSVMCSSASCVNLFMNMNKILGKGETLTKADYETKV